MFKIKDRMMDNVQSSDSYANKNHYTKNDNSDNLCSKQDVLCNCIKKIEIIKELLVDTMYCQLLN
jgi:hypothetical protein